MEQPGSTPLSHDSQDFEPSLPYAGTGGFVDVDTSRENAYDDVVTGLTSKAQKLTMILAAQAGARGITIAELRESKGALHHGKMSSALTSLHAAGRLVALRERRQRCGVYVLPEFQNDRDARPFKHNRKDVDPEVIVGVLLEHFRNSHIDYCAAPGCNWMPGYGTSFAQHQAEKIAEVLNG